MHRPIPDSEERCQTQTDTTISERTKRPADSQSYLKIPEVGSGGTASSPELKKPSTSNSRRQFIFSRSLQTINYHCLSPDISAHFDVADGMSMRLSLGIFEI